VKFALDTKVSFVGTPYKVYDYNHRDKTYTLEKVGIRFELLYHVPESSIKSYEETKVEVYEEALREIRDNVSKAYLIADKALKQFEDQN
jgi:delta-aminolevulinic acid dehydratase/porphobilinogen synthase